MHVAGWAPSICNRLLVSVGWPVLWCAAARSIWVIFWGWLCLWIRKRHRHGIAWCRGWLSQSNLSCLYVCYCSARLKMFSVGSENEVEDRRRAWLSAANYRCNRKFLKLWKSCSKRSIQCAKPEDLKFHAGRAQILKLKQNRPAIEATCPCCLVGWLFHMLTSLLCCLFTICQLVCLLLAHKISWHLEPVWLRKI